MNKNEAPIESHYTDLSKNASYFLYGTNSEERFAFARLLHCYEGKTEGGFIIAQLTSIPRVLQEEAFFGLHAGSWINQAKGGTLVISEIDSLVPAVQQKLACILQEGITDFSIIMTSAYDKALLLSHHALETGLHEWLSKLDSHYCVGAERMKAAQCLSSETLSGFSALIEPLLRDHVKEWLNAGINGLHGHVIAEIERPLIMMTLNHTRGNQIRAASLLGLNRNTLRKKIKELQITVSRTDKISDKKEKR